MTRRRRSRTRLLPPLVLVDPDVPLRQLDPHPPLDPYPGGVTDPGTRGVRGGGDRRPRPDPTPPDPHDVCTVALRRPPPERRPWRWRSGR